MFTSTLLTILAESQTLDSLLDVQRNPQYLNHSEIQLAFQRFAVVCRNSTTYIEKQLDKPKKTDERLPIQNSQSCGFSPTLAAPTLTGFGAINEVSWGNGVYLLPPLQKTGIIVIHQLPSIPDTLWFRLLGKGKVQQQAISEVAELPLDSPYRADALKLFGNLRVILAAQKSKKIEEQELIMQLSPLYLAEIQAAEDRGRQIGERREEVLIMRLLKRRVGDISLQMQERIKSLPLEKLDDLGEALLDLARIEELTAWLDTKC
jgi:hypothetical protein